MGKPLYTFEPFKQTFDSTLMGLIGLLLILLIVGLGLRTNKSIERNRKNVSIMVIAFIGMVAFGTLCLKVYSLIKMKPVSVYSNKIETPFGTTPLSNVKDFYIKREFKFKPMQPDRATDSLRLFYIIERNDKLHILSEADYPIDSILSKVNEVMGY